MTTEFTRVYADGGDDEWPNGWEEYRITVKGVLADDIRAKLGLPDATVEILERQEDGGYSEYTQETDYSFRLIVGGNEVFREDLGTYSLMPGWADRQELEGDPYVSGWNLRWLLKWLEEK